MNVITTPDAADVDIATVDQQIEQHAQNVERIQRDAVFEIGREFAAIQELHRYRRDGDGFTDFIATRFPSIPQRSVYQAIDIFKGVDGELFAQCANISPRALAEVAKAEPDVQAIVAERVAAGEVFTAAQVKEIKQTAELEAEAKDAEKLPKAESLTEFKEVKKLTQIKR